MGPAVWPFQFFVLAIHKFLRDVPIVNAILGVLFLVSNLLMRAVDKITPNSVIRDNAAVYIVTAQKN